MEETRIFDHSHSGDVFHSSTSLKIINPNLLSNPSSEVESEGVGTAWTLGMDKLTMSQLEPIKEEAISQSLIPNH